MAEAVHLATTKAGSPQRQPSSMRIKLGSKATRISTETERATRLIPYHSDDKEPDWIIVGQNIELGPGRIGKLVPGKNVIRRISQYGHGTENRDKFQASIQEASAGAYKVANDTRTGRLRFIVGDRFFIVGRMKDLIIERCKPLSR